ncbi:MAG: hypothetical protein APF84_08315 [Gracilibacter sp. BRH_c7a]|nr:MAG: hypothetical protein APF84_08315 [Gracilibacter sp. BRH_c7a]
MRIPLLALIFQGIPEQIAVVTLVFVLTRIRLEWKKIVLFGIILAFAAYVLRLFPITFGIHTIVLIGLQFVFLVQLYQAPVIIALRGTLIAFLIFIVIEYICFTLLIYLFDINFETYLNNIPTRILIGLPQVFLLFTLSYIILKVRSRREAK